MLGRRRRGPEAYQGVARSVNLSPPTTEALNALCARAGVTLFAGLHALVRCWLWCVWSETDVAVGSPVMMRNAADFSAVPGPFLEYLVLRAPVSGFDSLGSVLAALGAEIIPALRHLRYPPALSVARPAQRLFDVGLTLQPPGEAPQSRFSTDAARQSVFGIHTALWLDIAPLPHGLRIELVFNLGEFSEAEADEVRTCTQEQLTCLVEAPHRSLAELVIRPTDSAIPLNL